MRNSFWLGNRIALNKRSYINLDTLTYSALIWKLFTADLTKYLPCRDQIIILYLKSRDARLAQHFPAQCDSRNINSVFLHRQSYHKAPMDKASRVTLGYKSVTYCVSAWYQISKGKSPPPPCSAHVLFISHLTGTENDSGIGVYGALPSSPDFSLVSFCRTLWPGRWSEQKYVGRLTEKQCLSSTLDFSSSFGRHGFS